MSMTAIQLLEAMSFIDEGFVQEAEIKTKKRRIRWLPAVAAVLTLALAVSHGAARWEAKYLVPSYKDLLSYEELVTKDDLPPDADSELLENLGILGEGGGGGSFSQKLFYNGEVYALNHQAYGVINGSGGRPNTIHPLSDDWYVVGSVGNYMGPWLEDDSESWNDGTAEQFQSSVEGSLGCSVWASDAHPYELHLELPDGYYNLISAPYHYTWIRYGEKLYLYSDNYNFFDENPQDYRLYNIDGVAKYTTFLGTPTYAADAEFTVYPLATNRRFYENKELYLDEKNQILYVKIPGGVHPSVGEFTYWHFVCVNS